MLRLLVCRSVTAVITAPLLPVSVSLLVIFASPENTPTCWALFHAPLALLVALPIRPVLLFVHNVRLANIRPAPEKPLAWTVPPVPPLICWALARAPTVSTVSMRTARVSRPAIVVLKVVPAKSWSRAPTVPPNALPVVLVTMVMPMLCPFARPVLPDLFPLELLKPPAQLVRAALLLLQLEPQHVLTALLVTTLPP
jgi:hypothetical protein